MSVDYTRRSHETIDDYIARTRREMAVEREQTRASLEADAARMRSGGSPTEDEPTKALFSARREADTKQLIDPKKSRDQLLVEAIQEQFRRNPELGRAWQVAPGKISSN
jgi:hypothetical protein